MEENKTSAPVADTATPVANTATPVASGASKKGLYAVLGAAAVVVVAGVGIGAMVLSNNSGTNNGNFDYSARDPQALQEQLNTEAKDQIKALAAIDPAEIQSNPLAAFQKLAPQGDMGYDYIVNVDMESSGSQPFALDMNLEGQLATQNTDIAMNGKFDATIGGGFTFGLNGEYVFTDETFYLSVPNAAALIGTELPSKWISVSAADMDLDTSDLELSAEEQAEFEAEMEKLASYEGEFLTNGREADSITVYDVEIPCADYNLSSEYFEFVQSMTGEAAEEIPTETLDSMVYTICADGADKPMSFGFSFDIEQDGSTVNANMSIAYRTLSALPTISAPEASEVTSLEELTGGAAML